jgi:hypothetical protein
MEASRTILAVATVGVTALLAILALWQTVDADACASSDLDLAYCRAAVETE